MFNKIMLMLLPLLFIAGVAHAIPVTVEFAAENFNPIYTTGSYSAPTDRVAGTIVYEARDTLSPISSLIAADVTVNGHVYTADDLTFNSYGDAFIIGGANAGAGGMTFDTNDFWLVWAPSTLASMDFAYHDKLTPNVGWISYDLSEFSVTTSPVPEPSTFAFIGIGVLSIALFRRRLRPGAVK